MYAATLGMETGVRFSTTVVIRQCAWTHNLETAALGDGPGDEGVPLDHCEIIFCGACTR